MTTIQEVDIFLMVTRLRPNEPFHWGGSGQTGNTLGDVLELANPPSEAEVIAEWEKYLAEQAVAQAARQTAQQRLTQLRDQAAQQPLDPAADLSQAATLRQMVALLLKKVAWLEAELKALQAPPPAK